MAIDRLSIAALAEIGAIRNVIIHAMALKLLDDPDPMRALSSIDRQLTANPTEPTHAPGLLDPAVSDHLAALTDDRTQALMDDVDRRLAALMGEPV
jgi:hypothetical protein